MYQGIGCFGEADRSEEWEYQGKSRIRMEDMVRLKIILLKYRRKPFTIDY